MYRPPPPVKKPEPEVTIQELAIIAAVKTGFQPKSRSTTMDEINRFSPNGGTAMRDAVAMGVFKMIALQSLFVRADLFGVYQFVHVILTDGEDNQSKIPTYELSGLLTELNENLPPEFL